MSDLDELAGRVAKLEARAEIGDLITTYGRSIDDRDLELLGSLFTADAVFMFRNGLMKGEGADGIRALFADVLRLIPPSCHWTHGQFIGWIDEDPDRARGLVLAHSETVRGGAAFVAALHYEDQYRRVEGRWKFAERVLSFLYFAPAKDYPTILASPLRVRLQGEARQADFPEALESWRRFATGPR